MALPGVKGLRLSTKDNLIFDDFLSLLSQGGQSNNIEESTIYSLFASGYETKVCLCLYSNKPSCENRY